MYCGDIALRGYELNAEQRALDHMMVATQQDVMETMIKMADDKEA